MRLRKQQRLILVVLALLLLGGASGLVLFALSDSVAFFVTPSDIAAGKVDPDKRFRLGGLFASLAAVPGKIAFPSLTAREQEVLDLIARGYDNRRINVTMLFGRRPGRTR